MTTPPPALEERQLGRAVVLFGEQNGKYPQGNSLLVRGTEETVLIDPSLAVIPRHQRLPRIDRVLNSHCHEDHIAGNYLFPEASWHFHEADVFGIRSLEGMQTIYGYGDLGREFWDAVVREFHYTARPDAAAYRAGDVFDLGRTRLRVVHAPGHTRGHCLFHLEPEDILYLADIDLSTFGPYYGDAWSSLEDFERSIDAVRAMEARHYVTFHHIGVLDDRAAFLDRLDRFAAAIPRRERALLEFLAVPRTLDEIVEHRFLYPKHLTNFSVEAVERRSMSQHIERLLRNGGVREVEAGAYLATGS